MVLFTLAVTLGFLVIANSSPAEAAKGDKGKGGTVQLGYELYAFADGSFVVDYSVLKKGGNRDLAVHHQCFTDGTLSGERTRRLYWDGASQKTGSWNTGVTAGDQCTAVVVDLAQTSTGDTLSASTVAYETVSDPVSYEVG